MIKSPSFLSLGEIVDVRSAFFEITKDQNVDKEVTHFVSMALVVGILVNSTRDIELLLVFNI